jgi:hypothetical protein
MSQEEAPIRCCFSGDDDARRNAHQSVPETNACEPIHYWMTVSLATSGFLTKSVQKMGLWAGIQAKAKE